MCVGHELPDTRCLHLSFGRQRLMCIRDMLWSARTLAGRRRRGCGCALRPARRFGCTLGRRGRGASSRSRSLMTEVPVEPDTDDLLDGWCLDGLSRDRPWELSLSHFSVPTRLRRTSSAVFCLKEKIPRVARGRLQLQHVRTTQAVSYQHLRANESVLDLVLRSLFAQHSRHGPHAS